MGLSSFQKGVAGAVMITAAAGGATFKYQNYAEDVAVSNMDTTALLAHHAGKAKSAMSDASGTYSFYDRADLVENIDGFRKGFEEDANKKFNPTVESLRTSVSERVGGIEELDNHLSVEGDMNENERNYQQNVKLGEIATDAEFEGTAVGSREEYNKMLDAKKAVGGHKEYADSLGQDVNEKQAIHTACVMQVDHNRNPGSQMYMAQHSYHIGNEAREDAKYMIGQGRYSSPNEHGEYIIHNGEVNDIIDGDYAEQIEALKSLTGDARTPGKYEDSVHKNYHAEYDNSGYGTPVVIAAGYEGLSQNCSAELDALNNSIEAAQAEASLEQVEIAAGELMQDVDSTLGINNDTPDVEVSYSMDDGNEL